MVRWLPKSEGPVSVQVFPSPAAFFALLAGHLGGQRSLLHRNRR